MLAPPAFGPWAAALDPAERRARLRGMRAIVLLLARPHIDFAQALQRAESDAAWLSRAAVLLDELPTLVRRRVLASYAVLAGRSL